MDVELLPGHTAFRAEVRAFVDSRLPPSIRDKVLRGARLEKEDYQCWQRILHAHGWGAPNWPREYGGTGWDAVQQAVFDDECAAAGAPRQLPFGLKMLGPVLMRFGTEAQRERFLPDILRGDAWWCQGYSEPGAGSDLASLKTRAVLDGEHYVVDGQKTWTTLAQHADWMFCLARTDPAAKPQLGISFLLVDMRSPGVTVRPIITLDGEHEVNEVWLDAVRVPLAQRVGEAHQGWTIAKYLLGHERSNIAGVGICRREMQRLRALHAGDDARGRRLRADALARARMAQLEIDLLALEITQLRLLQQPAASGAASSMLKVLGSQMQQRIAEALLHAAGAQALGGSDTLPGAEHALLAAQYANWRKVSIYGGSNEIQRNILARAMGL